MIPRILRQAFCRHKRRFILGTYYSEQQKTRITIFDCLSCDAHVVRAG